MGCQNSGSARRNGLLDLFRVDIQSIWANINHNRFATLPDDTGSSSNITKRRGDDFTLQIEHSNCNLKRDRTITEKQQMVNVKLSLSFNSSSFTNGPLLVNHSRSQTPCR